MSTTDLAAAEATDHALREQIADLVRARARAEDEVRRLAGRASVPGTDASLDGIRERYAEQATRLAADVEALRADLRAHEPVLERLRAEAAGA